MELKATMDHEAEADIGAEEHLVVIEAEDEAVGAWEKWTRRTKQEVRVRDRSLVETTGTKRNELVNRGVGIEAVS